MFPWTPSENSFVAPPWLLHMQRIMESALATTRLFNPGPSVVRILHGCYEATCNRRKGTVQSISLCVASCISFHLSSDKCAWNVHPTNNAQASFAIASLHDCAFNRDLAAIHDPCSHAFHPCVYGPRLGRSPCLEIDGPFYFLWWMDIPKTTRVHSSNLQLRCRMRWPSSCTPLHARTTCEAFDKSWKVEAIHLARCRHPETLPCTSAAPMVPCKPPGCCWTKVVWIPTCQIATATHR